MSKTENNNNNKPFDDIEFKSLLIAFKGILVIFFIVVSLVLIFSIKSIAITENLDYNFENDYIFNSDDLDYDTFNIRNQTIITPQDNYTATYDFLDIPIDTTGTDIDFVDVDGSTGNCEAIIVDNLYEHNNILKLIDYNEAGTFFSVSNNLNDITYGTIEFWLLTSDANKQTEIFLFNEGDVSLYLMVKNNKFQYYTTSWNDIGMNAMSNHWYHIRIDFECTVGNYLGLNQYKFFIKVNGIQFGSFDFRYERNYFDVFSFQSYGVDVNYITYIDAIGYSWNIDYDIGQNLAFPETTTTNIQEIDKCEFAYNLTTFEPNILDAYIIDNNWIENDDSTNAHVKTDNVDDGLIISYYLTQDQNQYGIYKEFNYNNEGIYNISFDIRSMSLWSPEIDGWAFNIYTYDDTLLVSILLNATEPFLYYYDGNSYNKLHEIQDLFNEFSFNIYINNRVILRLKDDGVNYVWYFHELSTNIGIQTIEIIGGHKDEIGNLADVYIDSIGFYVNGSSYLPDDYYSKTINTDIEQWNDNIHNTFEITANSSFSFSIFYDNSFEYKLLEYDLFDNEKKKILEYDLDVFNGNQLYQFVFISNVSFTIKELSVYTISIKENSNIYYPSFTYNEVDIQENYFYIQNNRLYYTHNANQNDTLEYIQVSFNIDNEYALNSSVNFNSYFLGISKAYFSIDYVSETSTIYSIPISHESYNDILPQQQIINSFTFLITDNNDNDYYGNSEGYFSSIKLIYYPDIELTILTISLVEMMIPLIILIIPTLAISFIAGKKAIIPMLILMSIICYIAELIELGLLAIILICLGSFLFIQYKTEKKVN